MLRYSGALLLDQPKDNIMTLRSTLEVFHAMLNSFWTKFISPILFGEWDVIYIIAVALSILLIVIGILRDERKSLIVGFCFVIWVCCTAIHANLWAWNYEGLHKEGRVVPFDDADSVENFEYVATKKSIKYYYSEIENTPEELAINCFTSSNMYTAFYENTKGLDISFFTWECDEVTPPETFKIYRRTYTFKIPFSHDVTYNMIRVKNVKTGEIKDITY